MELVAGCQLLLVAKAYAGGERELTSIPPRPYGLRLLLTQGTMLMRKYIIITYETSDERKLFTVKDDGSIIIPGGLYPSSAVKELRKALNDYLGDEISVPVKETTMSELLSSTVWMVEFYCLLNTSIHGEDKIWFLDSNNHLDYNQRVTEPDEPEPPPCTSDQPPLYDH